MIFRRGVITDVDNASFRELVTRGLYSTGIRPDQVDEEKLWAYCKSLDGGYGAVAIEGERYVAYIGGDVAEHPFLARHQLTVGAWFSTSPGAGMKLLRDCIAWAHGQLTIRHVLIAVPVEARMKKIINRKYRALQSASFLIEV